MLEGWQTGEYAPLWRLRFMFFCHVTQAMFIVLPYTLSVFMVRDFLVAEGEKGYHPDEQRVGVMTGALGACSSAAALLTSFPIGILSDRVGRKGIILVGLVTSALSMLWYGAAPSYGQALAARAIGGALNGIIGAEKAMIGDSCDSVASTRAFSLFSLAWGLGTLSAPVLGGALSRPCAGKHGILVGTRACRGGGALLAVWPYFLPCAVVAALCLVALLLCTLGLDETLPALVQGARQQPGPRRESLQLARRLAGADAGEEGAAKWRADEAEESGALLPEMAPPGGEVSLGQVASAPPPVSWHKDAMVLRCLIGYGLVAFIYSLFDELLPLFASAPRAQGGLGLDPAGLAPSTAFAGAVLMGFTLLGLAPTLRVLGVLTATRLGLLALLPASVTVPLASEMAPGHPLLLQVPLFLGLAIRSLSVAVAFTGCLVLVNRQAARCGALGAVNGAGQAMSSAVRAAGPLAGGGLWAATGALAAVPWFPTAAVQYVPFAVVAGVAAATQGLYRGVKLPLEGVGADEPRADVRQPGRAPGVEAQIDERTPLRPAGTSVELVAPPVPDHAV